MLPKGSFGDIESSTVKWSSVVNRVVHYDWNSAQLIWSTEDVLRGWLHTVDILFEFP